MLVIARVSLQYILANSFSFKTFFLSKSSGCFKCPIEIFWNIGARNDKNVFFTKLVNNYLIIIG